MAVATSTVKKPSENLPCKRANRRCYERKQKPQNRIRATKGRNWEKTVEDASLLQEKPNWRPKKFPQITHQGFLFDPYGFEGIPFPLAVSTPMCTQCGHDTNFKSFVDWRLRIRSKGRCRNCGFESTISGTAAELEQAAWEEVCPIVRTE